MTEAIFERREKSRLASPGFWSLTEFESLGLGAYATDIMVKEIRDGVKTLSLVALALLLGAACLQIFLGLGRPYSYTYLILAALALHVYFSCRSVHEVKALYLLGLTLLVVSCTALVLQAHHAGSIGVSVYLGVTLILVVIPLVPWGLREALAVVLLIYMVVTLSTSAAAWRFASDTLILLQFFMVSVGMIVLLLVGRSAKLRKGDIQRLFELEEAHTKMRNLSYKDPLTGAWNRRFLHERYYEEVMSHHAAERPYYFLLFDVDRFKRLNDTYGHDYGDQVLKEIVESLEEVLGVSGLLVRMGGDEFAILSGSDPEKDVVKGIEALQARQASSGDPSKEPVTVSIGLVMVPRLQVPISFNVIYKTADELLYRAKKKSGLSLERGEMVLPLVGLYEKKDHCGVSP